MVADEETSDKVLLGLIANGDKSAMRVLFGRHNARLFRFLMRLVPNNATAEDLVSEVFVEVWRDAAKFEGRSQVATWLLSHCSSQGPVGVAKLQFATITNNVDGED